MGQSSPKGCMGQVWEGTSPRWAGAPPTKAQGARQSGRGQTLGSYGPKAHLVGSSPSLPSWPPPQAPSRAGRTPWGGNPRWGRSPPPPLYILRFWGCHTHENTSPSWRSPTPLPPPLPRCLAKPCGIATLLHHHHAIVLLLDGVFPNLSLSPCWIKAWETSPGCTCVERGGAVCSALGSPVIWITTTMTPSSPFS